MSLIQNQLANIFARNWWVLLIRGLAAILFGILTWLRPGLSLATLVLLFGAYALADGLLAMWAAIAGRHEHEHWWVLLLEGLTGIGVGLLTFMVPGLTAIAILFYIAVWAIARGVLEIAAAVRLRKEISGEFFLILGGLASVLFGFLLMARPWPGALAVLWLIAAYAVIFGVILVLLAFKVRSLGHRLEEKGPAFA
jgi:uncharacterized membrane protein HdeD (DUF308 family)